MSDDVLERSDGRKWYPPHHGVLHSQKKKLCVSRVTFQGVSLNSQLLQGPDLTRIFMGVLERSHKEPVVIIADTEAMFHQVKVPNEDCDLLWFLWWPDGDYSQNMVDYRMTVHLFGATSSPSCVNLALRRCAEDNMEKFSLQAVNTIKTFWMTALLQLLQRKTQELFIMSCNRFAPKEAFCLTSRSCHVLVAIPEMERAKETKNLDLDHDNLPMKRVLGVQWCVQMDVF